VIVNDPTIRFKAKHNDMKPKFYQTGFKVKLKL